MAETSSEPRPESRLTDLTAQATAKYAVKDYAAAAELYSRATELQAEINGEMSPRNADLLYAYGRCLYHVAVSNSDVLGTKVAGEKSAPQKKKSKQNDEILETNGEQKLAEEIVASAVEEKDSVKPEDTTTESKPYFQFTGDENYTDSDEEQEEAGGDEGQAEAEADDDDFSNAFEVLDLARLLLQRRLEDVALVGTGTEGGGGEEGGTDSETVRQLKERLADTYDLQAEISLEGEQFPNAVVDLKAALELKEELFPPESSLLAEAHYKLALALEFSSVTQQKDANGEVDATKGGVVDEAMREEAAKEMEAAIASCRARIEKEEKALANNSSVQGDKTKMNVTRESIDDVKEMVRDMEQRVCYASKKEQDTLLITRQVIELRQPPVSVSDPTGTGSLDGSTPLSGILGSILGESPEEQKKRLEEASKGANDLTNLVKRKKRSPSREAAVEKEPVAGDGKRKADSLAVDEISVNGKKAKVEEAGE